MEDNNKVYSPGIHFYQVKQLMQELYANIEKLKKRDISFYLDASVLLASTTKSEYSKKLMPSFYASYSGILSLYLIPVVNADSKIGFVDQKCKIVAEPLYDEIKGTFSCKNSIVAVCKDKMWNVIDSEGKELLSKWTKNSIVPSKDSRMITFNSNAILNVDNPKSLQYIKGGKELSYVGGFRYGFARVHRNNLWGIINEKGEEVVPAKYIEMYDFYDYPCPTTKVRKSKDDNWEYIDLNKLK
jgi:hypothetical protein